MGTENASPEERMMAFVEREDDIPEEQEKPSRFSDDVPEPTSIAEEEDRKEAAEEEPETQEESPEDRILRLKHDGVEIEKPESEVIALAQQGFDYTQKTQKLAEDRKQVDEHAQTLRVQEQNFQQQVQVQSALITEIAKATAIDQQLSQYQSLDWQALSNTDPVEAQKLFFAYNQLQVQRGQVVAEINQKQQALNQTQQQGRAQQLQMGQQVLAKEIPGWGPDLAKSLMLVGKEYGFNDQELANFIDPRHVKVLHDAAQWRKLQASKPITDKKVASASPMVKPGAKDTKNAANSRDKANREQLRKTGKSDYAAKLIERML